MLSDAERLDWLRLIRTPNVGPVTFAQLLRRYRTAGAALQALPDLAARGGRRIAPAARDVAEKEMAGARKAGARLLLSAEPDYPRRLAETADAPPVLYALGDTALTAKPAIAVVGARNASALGIRFARQLAGELGQAGLVVVSGLARGIDGAAHEASLGSGTIAVLGTGIDVPFPPENADLYKRVAAQGLVLSEYLPGTPASPTNFPRRNRIIAGTAIGTVVVEGAVKSGSLLTARMALDYGREVFAVPGSPLDPRAHGPNGLIRQGATLVQGAEDVLEVLRPILAGGLAAPAETGPEAPPVDDDVAIDAARPKVLERMGASPVGIDELARQVALPHGALMTVLLELELAGRIRRHPGHKVSLE